MLHEVATAISHLERPGAARIAPWCQFNLDHLGAHLCHHQRGGWSRDHLTEVQHLVPVEHMLRIICSHRFSPDPAQPLPFFSPVQCLCLIPLVSFASSASSAN